MEYFVVTNKNPTSLEADVNKMLNQGYIPLGPMQMAPVSPNRDGMAMLFSQTLVRMGPNDPWPNRQ